MGYLYRLIPPIIFSTICILSSWKAAQPISQEDIAAPQVPKRHRN